MNLLERIKANRIPVQMPSYLPVPQEHKKSLFLWPDFRLDRPLKWTVGNFENYTQEGFQTNALIYSAIMYKVRAQQGAPLRAYRGDSGHPELLSKDHALARLVARPNPHQSWAEFQGQNTAYLNIAGNVYIRLERPARGGTPTAMYSLRPDRVFIVPSRKDQKRGVMGFLYVPENVALANGIPIVPEDMIHVKLPNPLDPMEGMGYGLSPLAPIAYSADVDNSATKFIREFFMNGALFTGLLTFQDPLQDEEIQRIKKRWKEQYGGYENWSDVGVLDSAGKYERISMTFQEMGFTALDERNESRIIGPLGVPAILLQTRYGLARSTLANYAEAKGQFWEDTFQPEMSLYEPEYRYFLQGERDEFVAFDYSGIAALQESRDDKITAWTLLVDRGIPKNVAAEIVGLKVPELPDGYVVYMPVGMVPMGTMGEPPPSEAPEAEEQTEEGEKQGRKALAPFRLESATERGHR